MTYTTYSASTEEKKSTTEYIMANLTLVNLTIAPEYKEYKLRRSDNFPIIIENEKVVSIKQQRSSIGKAN